MISKTKTFVALVATLLTSTAVFAPAAASDASCMQAAEELAETLKRYYEITQSSNVPSIEEVVEAVLDACDSETPNVTNPLGAPVSPASPTFALAAASSAAEGSNLLPISMCSSGILPFRDAARVTTTNSAPSEGQPVTGGSHTERNGDGWYEYRAGEAVEQSYEAIATVGGLFAQSDGVGEVILGGTARLKAEVLYIDGGCQNPGDHPCWAAASVMYRNSFLTIVVDSEVDRCIRE